MKVYLQAEQLDKLPAEIEVEPTPVLFAALLNRWGQLGPAEIPPKRLFTYRHVQWLAERSGLVHVARLSANPGLFETDAMRRIAGLPQLARRR